MAMDYIDRAKKQLAALGWSLSAEDHVLLDIAYRHVREHILNFCNVREIPDGLAYTAVNRICGEFLHTQRACGSARMDGIDLSSPAVKSFTVGDVSFTYEDGQMTDDQRLDLFIAGLRDSGKDDVLRYRKIVW